MDKNETAHIAKLARLKFGPEELESIAKDISGILKWVDVLQNADAAAADSIPDEGKALREREDKVTEGGEAEELVKNAPEPYGHFFTVPRVVE